LSQRKSGSWRDPNGNWKQARGGQRGLVSTVSSTNRTVSADRAAQWRTASSGEVEGEKKKERSDANVRDLKNHGKETAS